MFTNDCSSCIRGSTTENIRISLLGVQAFSSRKNQGNGEFILTFYDSSNRFPRPVIFFFWGLFLILSFFFQIRICGNNFEFLIDNIGHNALPPELGGHCKSPVGNIWIQMLNNNRTQSGNICMTIIFFILPFYGPIYFIFFIYLYFLHFTYGPIYFI